MTEDKNSRQNRFADISRSGPVNSKRYMVTLNNPGELTLERIHSMVGAHYTVGQLEQGQSGTLHLQFFQTFKKPVRLSHYKKYLPRAHVEMAIAITEDCKKYVTKDETRIEGPWEYGEVPLHRNSKEDWEKVFQKAKNGEIESIPADIRVRCYSNLKKIEKDYLKPEKAEDLRGWWICGPSGYGKSCLAEHLFPNAYPKGVNKWWDGYQGQKDVIMNDLDDKHACLGHHLKLWGDRFPVVLETKCGSVSATYTNFCVTSQYSIDDIWQDDKTREAIKRRFKVIHLPYKIVEVDQNGSFKFSISDEQLNRLVSVPRGMQVKVAAKPNNVISNINSSIASGISSIDIDQDDELIYLRGQKLDAEHKLRVIKDKVLQLLDDNMLKDEQLNDMLDTI